MFVQFFLFKYNNMHDIYIYILYIKTLLKINKRITTIAQCTTNSDNLVYDVYILFLIAHDHINRYRRRI